jgi:cytochrome c oxidase accessory protein FixG
MQENAPYRPERDVVTTIRDDGSRRFLFPADAKGRFLTGRRIVALVLIGIYALLPWIKVGGYPAIFLDVADRRFHLMGRTLAIQDLWLMFFLISGVGFSLFFITALFGRIWCGWACPHTVFLDHVYRRIERWIDGDAIERRSLAKAPLGAAKFARRALKHTLYILFSAAIAHMFLSYFVSIPAVWAMMGDAPTKNWGTFVFIAVATGIVYFNFAWFREQLCIVICPYGRLQSVLTDDHTLTIGYDTARGEPRGKPESAGVGDCVDCDRCVKVCPTGIDIRQGLQLECVGCAACIDACDDVMQKLGRRPGLVRYDSLAGFAGRAKRWVRPRTILYGVLLAIGASVAAWNIGGIRPAILGVTRMVGAPYYVDGGSVRNQFLVRIVNKRSEPAEFKLRMLDLPPGVEARGIEAPFKIAPLGEETRPLIVQEPRSLYTVPFSFQVEVSDSSGSFRIARSMGFMGPDPAADTAAHGSATDHP